MTSTRMSKPTLILAISNGAGHIRAAEAISEATGAGGGSAVVVDVADYMSRTVRFTHVTAYLWLVKNAPRLWDRIDRYQKRQRQTSPDWYYRRGCRRLIQLVRELRPKAMVATEVGCCEIAALIKRDLKLDVPLVAVNVNYDADLAWVQPEVDLYGVATEQVRAELMDFGAPQDRIAVWGVPMSAGFATLDRDFARADVCRWLKLDPDKGLVLIAGGGEGIGPIEEITLRLMQLELTPQIIVVTGKNQRLQRSIENLISKNRNSVRVLGWTNRIAELMRASDVMVSKLGNTFDEAIVAELPIVALEPPPGSERVQYKLLDEWGVGSAVRTVDEMADTIVQLLGHPAELEAMRAQARGRRLIEAGDRVAEWLRMQCAVAEGRPKISATSALVVNDNAELLHLQQIEARSQ
jgi:processive 1,2-diacylglycerol beta-glucosyltransferase